MYIMYVSDLTVVLFSVWFQGASGKKKRHKRRLKNKLASTLLTLYCGVTLLTQVCFYSTFDSDAKTVYDVQGFTGLLGKKKYGRVNLSL